MRFTELLQHAVRKSTQRLVRRCLRNGLKSHHDTAQHPLNANCHVGRDRKCAELKHRDRYSSVSLQSRRVILRFYTL
jgi:hypothetical protein